MNGLTREQFLTITSGLPVTPELEALASGTVVPQLATPSTQFAAKQIRSGASAEQALEAARAYRASISGQLPVVSVGANGYAGGLPAIPTTINGGDKVSNGIQTGQPVVDGMVDVNQIVQAGMGGDWSWLVPLLSGVAGLALGGGIGSGITGATTGYQTTSNGSGILQGPGVPEPLPGTYYKTWHTKYERKDGRDGLVYFWALNDGRIVSWDNLSGRSKVWKPSKPVAVIMPRSKMTMRDFLKADRYLDRFTRALAKRSKRLALQRS